MQSVTARGSERAGLTGSAHRTTVRYRLSSADLLPVTQSLSFGERSRRVFMRARADLHHSQAFTGKTGDGVPLEGHLHAFFLPEDADGDGRIDHLAVHAAGGFDADDAAALDSSPSVFGAHGRPGIRMAPVDASGGLFGESAVWRSATPFVLPRFATSGSGRKLRRRDLPEAQLLREIGLRGLPEPVRIVEVAGYATVDGRMIPWSEFETVRRNGARGFGVAGFEIEFPQPVPGPIALGFGCHFGLGVFVSELTFGGARTRA